MRRSSAPLLIFCFVSVVLSLSCRLTNLSLGQPATPTPVVSDDWACIGTSDGGAACLTPSGWQVYNHAGGALTSDRVSALSFCPDGRLVVLNSGGLSVFDGEQWTQQIFAKGMYPSRVACDRQNSLWVGYYGGVARLKAGQWVQTSTVDLFGADDKSVLDVEAGPDGVVWALSYHHLARYDQSNDKWRVFSEPEDWPEKQTFGQLALDSEGRPWMTNLYGLFHLDKGKWQQEEGYIPVGVYDLRWDGQKHLWIATMDGVREYSGGLWNKLAVGEGPGLPLTGAERVGHLANAAAVDERGRIWVGTQWGLAVFDGDRWRGYLMQNSALADNNITALAVQGGGPASLPETSSVSVNKPGSELTGVLVQGGEPLRDAAVRLCGEAPQVILYPQDPCKDQVMLRETVTDADGAFDFYAIPAGHYYLVARPMDAPRWLELTGRMPVPFRVLVEPGQLKDLGQIKLPAK